jgi:hypothetical protein
MDEHLSRIIREAKKSRLAIYVKERDETDTPRRKKEEVTRNKNKLTIRATLACLLFNLLEKSIQPIRR